METQHFVDIVVVLLLCLEGRLPTADLQPDPCILNNWGSELPFSF